MLFKDYVLWLAEWQIRLNVGDAQTRGALVSPGEHCGENEPVHVALYRTRLYVCATEGAPPVRVGRPWGPGGLPAIRQIQSERGGTRATRRATAPQPMKRK